MWWEEIQEMIDCIKYLDEQPPNERGKVTEAYSGESPIGNYGVRMSGHLIPWRSGEYTFWIAADDGCRLWLNTNNDVADMVRIAGWYRYSGNFDAHPEQKSAPIYLESGQKYAIEILLKEGGGDWVDVAWEGPDAPSRTRIVGGFLTSAYAVNPKPDIRESITPLEAVTLSWTAGKYATSPEVLFGMDPGTMALIATLPVETTSYPAPALALDTTYYWQVNEVNGTDVWEGDIWSYTVSEWVSRDIGSHEPAGSHAYEAGVHVINADGDDIWNQWDEFHFFYTTPQFTRDQSTIIAQVLSLEQINTWSKAGVMIRQSLAADSKNVCTLTTPSGGQNTTTLQRRDVDGGWSSSTYQGGVGGVPEWVKLVRNGNVFKGYHSEDGVNWQQVGEYYVEMNSDIYVGLAVTSHDPEYHQITTATFDNFTVTTLDPHEAWNPIPADEEVGVNIHAILQWNAGDDATQHLVYFSEDKDAVVNREALVATLPVDVTEFNPFPSDRQTLDLGKTYYWAVDGASFKVSR